MAVSIFWPMAVSCSRNRLELDAGTKSLLYIVSGEWWQAIERQLVNPVAGIL